MNQITKQDRNVAIVLFVILLVPAIVMAFFTSTAGIVIMGITAFAYLLLNLLYVFDKISITGFGIIVAWVLAAIIIFATGVYTS